jgi:cytoskeletal protein CcmA (bactofilin family)
LRSKSAVQLLKLQIANNNKSGLHGCKELNMGLFRKKSGKQAAVTALIGNSTHVGRDFLSFRDGIYIHGHVELDVVGTGKSKTAISISEDGKVDGDVRAVDVYVAGTVHGDVRATGHLRLMPTARIHGDVEYASLDIADGAIVQGAARRLS